MTIFGQDTFAGEATNIPLGDRAGWVVAPTVLGLSVDAANERLYSASTAARGNYHTANPASAEYDVSADVFGRSNHGVVGRQSTTDSTFYVARFSTTAVQLYRFVAGSASLLGSYSQSTDGPHHIRLEIRDTAKKVYVDGVERISSSDNNIVDAGYAGVRSGGTGAWIDNFVAEDLSGGGSTQVATSPGTLGLSGPAPSSAFSGAITSAPGVGALTITPQAAEILFSGAITSAPEPGLLDLASHPSQSAFSGAVTSATLPGSLAFSGLAGQIIVSGAATVTVLTAAGALGLTGAAPSSAYSGTVRAQTLPGLLALAGVAPGLLHSGAVTVELLAGELSVDGQAVETTIGGGIRVETAAGLLSLLGNAPSVVISGGVRVETQPGSMALNGAAPVMIHAGLIEIVTAAGGLSIAGLPVTVSAGERLGPIFAPGLHSITVQRAVLSVTPIRGLRRFDGH